VNQPSSRLPLAVIVCLLCFACFPARAWSNKEHIQLTRIAAELLVADPSTPAAMKDWLKNANRQNLTMEQEREWFLHQRVGTFPRSADGLGFWATMPDMDKGGPSSARGKQNEIEPFGLPEAQLHFVDLEYLNADEAKRTYMDDLSHKPKLADVPRDMKDPRWQKAGMLPFRVEDVYKKIIADLKAGKLYDKDGQYPRDEHAAKWAGYLAHYLEDNTQPQHSTSDYQSRVYFGHNVRSPNVHSDVEFRLMDDDTNDYMPLREEYWVLFTKALAEVKDPVETNDPWQGTMEVLMKSYDALPLIGRAAMEAYGMKGTPAAPEGHPGEFDADKFFHFKGTYDGREMTVLEMKAYQQAWAVKRVQRMWRQAWEEGSR
jgi:hypothetical protein